MTTTPAAKAEGPLGVSRANPRYFADRGGAGRLVFLTGSHVWNNLQDMGATDPPPAFDWNAYLGFLDKYHHNFVRLWRWELTSWNTSPLGAWSKETPHIVSPHPWLRTGPGKALDGKPKFDLTQYDPAYFTRLRSRVESAARRGVYVSIMLFEGWGLQFMPDAWKAHPFHPDNNINGVGREVKAGVEVHELKYPDITRIQETYVRKVIDTVNEFDNVLYEISNENHPPSTEWQYHMIRLIKKYEASKPKQHPVGMTFQYRGGSNRTLFDGPADWISPNPEGGFRTDPPAADGSKVILSDTDHLWGIGGNADWVWKTFMRGMNPIFMDPYDGAVLGKPFAPAWEPVRLALGRVRRWADRVDLEHMTPVADRGECSTGYCLRNPAREYLVYQPRANTSFTLRHGAGVYHIEWYAPESGKTVRKGETKSSGGRQTFTPPCPGPAVLYLMRTEP